MQGIVFNIQHDTIDDGPGIRTELFLKGCSLRCPWCSNPEGLTAELQPGVYHSQCISAEVCGLCLQVCPTGALMFSGTELTAIDRERCIRCMACVRACPADALKQWGRRVSVEEAMEEIRRDKKYYDRSGGGVTISGGEPLLQVSFVAALFQACRNENIATCCETALDVNWNTVEQVLPWTDLFITDIKHMDSRMHRRFCGAGNERILENQKHLVRAGKELIVRVPVIPGVNDDPENMKATADFIQDELGGKIRTLQLLSFMRLGEEKYRSLGLPYPMRNLQIDRQSFQKKVERAAVQFQKRGIPCTVGSKEMM